jgi:hypothetical protein
MVAALAASVHGDGRTAGYRYDISIVQAEFATTHVLDRPVHGRVFLRAGDLRKPRPR